VEDVRFEVSTAVTTTIIVFWEMIIKVEDILQVFFESSPTDSLAALTVTVWQN
jgi:hypothetical protein